MKQHENVLHDERAASSDENEIIFLFLLSNAASVVQFTVALNSCKGLETKSSSIKLYDERKLVNHRCVLGKQKSADFCDE
jgi:hypothetical protein